MSGTPTTLKQTNNQQRVYKVANYNNPMNKKAQMSFPTGEFSQQEQTMEVSNPNMFQRVGMGILIIIFLIVFAPIIVAIHSAMQPLVCINPTLCLFYKFIVPAFILGGIIAALKFIWTKN